MDPTACFQRFVDAVSLGDTEEAAEAIHDLDNWYQRGGYCAKWPGGNTEISGDFVNQLATSVELWRLHAG